MRTHRPKRNRLAALIVGLMVATILPTVAAVPAAAIEPAHLSVTFEGCKGSAGSFPAAGPFVCADNEYTTGNLGGGWNELDLVPHRLTLSLGSQSAATTAYDFAVTADYKSGAATGYDFISVPVVNTAKSHTSCAIGPVGAQTATTDDAEQYRLIRMTQNRGTTCVLDYYERLALGSALYPGSSLHSHTRNENLGTQGIGNRDISIPVKEIAPQSISKTMSATQGSDHAWNVTKSPSPASLNFGDTCSAGAGPYTLGVAVTVNYTKLAATPSGDVTIITNVYATNPSHRVITVHATDVVKSGAIPVTALTGSNTASTPAAGVDVPANTADQLLFTHTLTVAAGTPNLNDTATATYEDKVTGFPITGTTTANASATVQNTGPTTNATAVISDVESITGTGLDFKVDSVTGSGATGGTFGGGYTLGSYTTGPVSWTSASQSASGSVTFNKTVRLDQPRITTGTLTDTATVTGSNGSVVNSDPLNIGLSSTATTTLDIDKSMNLVFDSAKTFNFSVRNAADVQVATAQITIPAGQTTGSTSVSSLPPGDYTVNEAATAPFGTQSQNVTLALPSCSETVTFTNQADPATARVRKITDPLGATEWDMTLTGPNGLDETISATANAGYADFTGLLEEDGGVYTITETTKTAWDNTLVAGDLDNDANRVTTSTTTNTCSFTLDLTTDSGGVFSCTFTNVERGTVSVVKTNSGGALGPNDSFEFQLRRNATTASNGTVLDTEVANQGNGGNLSFAEGGDTNLVPGTYQVCEYIAVGWSSSIQTMTGAFVPGTGGSTEADNTYVCVPVVLAAGDDAVVNVDNTPPPGGMAKTIGFWRNHSSCKRSNGGQDPVLDAMLLAAGFTPWIGDLEVDHCAQAYDLMSKMDKAHNTTILDGKKRASDAAFNAAAQLMAYRLNIAADAGSCTAADDAATRVQNKLAYIDFNGNTHDAMTATMKTALNNLEQKLDSYNNNTLCP